MFRNQNNSDRLGRILLGLAFLSLFFFGPKSPWGLMGLIPLSTGLLGYCPIYHLFGWSTCGGRWSRVGHKA